MKFKKIRLRKIDEPIFPYYLSKKLIAEYFTFTSKNYDFTILPIIKEEYQTNFNIDTWKKYLCKDTPTAIIHTLDEYWNKSNFNQSMIDICEKCNLVFGYQIPVSKSQDVFTPIFYRPLIEPINNFEFVRKENKHNDIFFWGAGATDKLLNNLNIEQLPLLERDYRAFVINKIIKIAEKNLLNLDIENIYYWKLSNNERLLKSTEFRKSLSESKLGLSLYGFGFNTFRNADVFSMGCTLLSPKIYNHILLPEMDKWTKNELGYFFNDDCSNLEETIMLALENKLERERRAFNGHLFFKKNCTEIGIIKTIYSRLLKFLNSNI